LEIQLRIAFTLALATAAPAPFFPVGVHTHRGFAQTLDTI
jgi:hypothetical protein